MKWEKFTTDFITKLWELLVNLKGNLMKIYVILYKIKQKNLNGKKYKKEKKKRK